MQLNFPISERFKNKQQQNTMMNARKVLCLILVFVLVDISAAKVYFSLDWTAAQAALSLRFLLVMSYRGYVIMSIAYMYVGTDRLGVYMVPFYLPLLSTLSITYITHENSCRCLYLFARRINDSMLQSCGQKS